MKEIWKDIEGYEGLYQVSSLGRVKSLGNDKKRKEKILKPRKNGWQYLSVGLCKQGEAKNYLVHRLVASAFIENLNNLPQVNHKNESKTDNRASNLEYCTALYNNNYGTRNQRAAEKLSKQVMCVETGKVYNSLMEVKRELGFDNSSITKCCKGRLKTCGGFNWKYVD